MISCIIFKLPNYTGEIAAITTEKWGKKLIVRFGPPVIFWIFILLAQLIVGTISVKNSRSRCLVFP